MKKWTIPILNNEYKVVVVVGTDEERAKFVSRYCEGWNYEKALDECEGTRGNAFNTLGDKHPLITIDGDCEPYQAFATLAHEASHVVHYIMEYLEMEDPSDEFRGHSIGAIVRTVLKDFKISKKKK